MRLPLSMSIVAAGILAVAVFSRLPGSDYEDALRLRERREILPLEDLLRRAGLDADARILEIESEFEHGRRVYEVEYLDAQGRIHEILIDAGSGEVLGQEDD